MQINRSLWLDHQASTHKTAFLEASANPANLIPAKDLLTYSLKKSVTGHPNSNQTKSVCGAIAK